MAYKCRILEYSVRVDVSVFGYAMLLDNPKRNCHIAIEILPFYHFVVRYFFYFVFDFCIFALFHLIYRMYYMVLYSVHVRISICVFPCCRCGNIFTFAGLLPWTATSNNLGLCYSHNEENNSIFTKTLHERAYLNGFWN